VVHYVRDSREADVHVLVTAEGTAEGGSAVTIAFLGRHAFRGVDDALRYTLPPDATDDSTHRAFLAAFTTGLVRYVEHSHAGLGLRVSFASPPAGAAATRRDDPWHAWVFSLGATGGASGEQVAHTLNLASTATASRTTADWKIIVGGAAATSLSTYTLDSTIVKSSVAASGIGGYIVRSVGAHFSIGLEASNVASTYLNERQALHAAPALEYDLFAYADATRRQFTLTYTAGASQYRYHAMTVFGRLEELRPQQTLQVAFGERQPWGTVGVSLDGANYFDDLTQHHLTSAAAAQVHVARGLSLSVGGQLSFLHDQLYLPAANASPVDILLRRQQLATGYQYGTSVGFTYTFGSSFADVVNPRLAVGSPSLTPGL
jgi:hypothetical protein